MSKTRTACVVENIVRFSTTMKRSHVLLDRAEDIELFASSVRQNIYDTLEGLGGEAPVSTIAAALGRTSDGLYYHLRLLARAGLIEELPDAGSGRRYRTTTPAGKRLRLHYRPGKTRNAAAVRRVTASMLRTAERDVAKALADPRTVVSGPARELWAARAQGWIGKSERAEILRLLERVLVLLGRGRSARRDQLASFTWVLAPLRARPVRR
jgi:DNA-binding transcriptional ArsR family regulator